MAARRALSTRTLQTLSLRPSVASTARRVARMPQAVDSGKIAVRRLHATTSHLQAATASLPTEVPTSHEKVSQPIDTANFLDNKFVPSQATQWIDLHDPATNNLVTRVPQTTDAELKAAVDSAEAAFPAWKATSIMHRQQIMFKYTALIRENWDRLAASITLEQGKTLADAKGDVLRGLQVAETACGITTQITGEVLEVAKDMETRSYREPLGVIAAICPFNFPAMIPLWTIPIATITGNTCVIKPSERDPGATMILAELAEKAGFPPGVINIIHGSAKTVDFIIDEPRIKAISFVGSNKAGEYIYTRGSANGKRVQANLGAKNHAAVLPDCNKNHALNAISGAAFGAAGQRCMALSTLVLVGETKDWMPELAERAKELSMNGGFEEGADLGPVISPQAKERIENLIASAEKEGATILLDGRGQKPEKYPNGNWVSLSLLLASRATTTNTTVTGRPHNHHKRNPRDDLLQRGNLRPSPRLPLRPLPRRCHLPHQRKRIRQRHRNLHTLRRNRHTLPEGDRGRPGWNQRPHPRASSHVLFHRKQEVRRRWRIQHFLRQAWCAVLHSAEDCDELLEGGGCC
jgi:malonate-semialdehyde dehydrogenase (acetylating)/methylmalonate-semialdehyde dehydrogenase